jgi:hypothetical protein
VARPDCYSKVHGRNTLVNVRFWLARAGPIHIGLYFDTVPSRHLAGMSPHPPQFNFAFPLLPKCKRGLSLHPLPLRIHVRPHNANSMSRPPCSGDRVCHAARSPDEWHLEDAWRRWLPGKPDGFLVAYNSKTASSRVGL